jgi:long-chain acyl-CoA synthetase
VVLTHRNIVASVSGIHFINKWGRFLNFSSQDRYLSYLPLAHILERIIIAFAYSQGASVGFYQGDQLKLLEDLAALQPTVFISVPRLFNRIYDKVQEGVKAKGVVARKLFQWAYNTKLKNLKQHGRLTHWLWDRIIFSSIRSRLGGSVRCLFSGSAPMNPSTLDFMRICFSCPFIEGYGQTEICATGTTTSTDDIWPGSVGAPFPCIEIKLVDVPELGYLSTDQPFPRGEVCFRGACVMTEYYKDAEKTKETIDSEGWLHSGDIGKIDNTGRLHLIDRKKSIFKLSQGEYVAPEKVEGVVNRFHLAESSFIHGNSLKSCVVAVICPNKDAFISWISAKGLFSGAEPDYVALCSNPRVKKLFLEELNAHCRASSLKGFEIPKAVHLDPTPFTIANDLLTSTFKLKRPNAISRYSMVVEDLYSAIEVAQNQ